MVEVNYEGIHVLNILRNIIVCQKLSCLTLVCGLTSQSTAMAMLRLSIKANHNFFLGKLRLSSFISYLSY